MSVQLGPFQIQSRFAVGGMGEIWRGLHAEQNVPVAIKVITGPNALLPEFQDEFRREVQAVARLNHPNIVQVFDYGILPDDVVEVSKELVARSPYLVMEYASRGSLANQLEPLNWRDLKNILMSVLGGLSHAHARGVIHRDIKPGNVLLGSYNETPPRIILTDFGVAHAADQQTRTDASELTARSTEEASGTPRYMAPEQFMGKWRDYGPWTDLYAVGIMAYELACGALPFKGGTFMMLAMAHLNNPFPPLKPRIDLPDGFERWVQRMTAKKPQDRFRSAADASWALTELNDSHLLFSELSNIVGDNYDDDDEWDSTDMLPTRIDFAPPEALRIFTMSKTSDRETYPDAPALPLTWQEAEPPHADLSMVGAGLGLFGLRSIPVVGREAERTTIWNAFQEVYLSKEPRAVILRGLAGTGKTCLARWVAQLTNEIGAAVQMEANHGPVAGPMHGLAWMLTRHFRAAGLSADDAQERIESAFARDGVDDQVQARALTEVMRSSQQVDTGQTGRLVHFTSPDQRYGVIRKVIERESQYRPALVLLDDIQFSWESIDFVRHVLDHDDSHAVLFIMTVGDESLAERPDEAHMLKLLAKHARVSEVVVPPLPRRDVVKLVEGHLGLPGDLAADVTRRAAGSPLFAIQLVEDWVKRGILVIEGSRLAVRHGETATVPTSLTQLWESRIAYLIQMLSDGSVGGDTSRIVRPISPEDTRKSLEIAAALGQDVNIREWLAICERVSLSVYPEMIDEMTRLRMATQEGVTFSFINAQLREPLVKGARDSERWTSHNIACAQVLMTLHDQDHEGLAERVGAHFLEAGAYQLALTALQEAYRQAQAAPEHRDQSELNDLIARTYECMGVPETDSRWAELRVRRGIPMIYSEDQEVFDQGLALLENAEEIARAAGDRKVLASILRAEAWAAAHSGAFDEGIAKIEEAAELAGPKSKMRAAIERTHGHVLLRRGDVDEAVECFETTLALAPDSVHAVWARQQLAECALAKRDYERVESELELALSSARESGILLAEAAALETQGLLALERERPEDAVESLQQSLGIRDLVSGSDSNLASRTRERLARALLDSDDAEAAQKLLDQIQNKIAQGARSDGLHPADALLLSAALRNDWAGWDILATDAITFDGAPERFHVSTLMHAAQKAADKGRFRRAVALYERLLDLLDSTGAYGELQTEITQNLDALEEEEAFESASTTDNPPAADPEDPRPTIESELPSFAAMKAAYEETLEAERSQGPPVIPAGIHEDSEPEPAMTGVQMITAEELARARDPSSNSFMPYDPDNDGYYDDYETEYSEISDASEAEESEASDVEPEDDFDASDVLEVLEQSGPLLTPSTSSESPIGESGLDFDEEDELDLDLAELDELEIAPPITGSGLPRVPEKLVASLPSAAPPADELNDE